MKLSKKYISINTVEFVGYDFLRLSTSLQAFYAPRLRRAGRLTMHWNASLTTFHAPKCGDLSTALLYHPNRDTLLKNKHTP